MHSEMSKVYFLYRHQENVSMKYIPLHTPLIYRKTGVYRGIPIFLIFVPKHRLWVLGEAVLT